MTTNCQTKTMNKRLTFPDGSVPDGQRTSIPARHTTVSSPFKSFFANETSKWAERVQIVQRPRFEVHSPRKSKERERLPVDMQRRSPSCLARMYGTPSTVEDWFCAGRAQGIRPRLP